MTTQRQAGHRCALPDYDKRPAGTRFVCDQCDSVWVWEPFHRLWRYAVTPFTMIFRWVITLGSLKRVNIISVGWRKRRNLNLGIVGHWLWVAAHSVAIGSLALF